MDTKAVIAALESLIDELNAEDVRRATQPPPELAAAEVKPELDALKPEASPLEGMDACGEDEEKEQEQLGKLFKRKG